MLAVSLPGDVPGDAPHGAPELGIDTSAALPVLRRSQPPGEAAS